MTLLRRLKKLNSIRYRILLGFFIIIIIYLFSLLISYNYISRLESIRHNDKKIAQLEALTLIMIKKDNDFFDLEAINPQFFETRESQILEDRSDLNKKIHNEFNKLLKTTKDTDVLTEQIRHIQHNITRYNARFDKLVEFVYLRGFKDYGLEGRMRVYAHQLEDLQETSNITAKDILTLRRHEKDFFLRSDIQYIKNFNEMAEIISKKIADNYVKELLNHYQLNFNQLADLQFEIGLNSKEGLRNELNFLTDEITDNFASLLQLSEQNLNKNAARVKTILLIVSIFAVLISTLIGINIALKLSRPIRVLSRVMSDVVRQRFTKTPNYYLTNPTTEIELLSSSFNQLMYEMDLRMKDIKDKSLKLKSQNQDLLKLNNELDNFLYSTAHDLRSPLTSLLGLINLSQYENKDPKMIPYFNMMKESVKKMEAFIADVVSYAKNNKIEREIERVNIQLLIEQLIDYNKLLSTKEFDFQIDIQDQYPLYSDKNRLKIILNNLISNSVKYQDLSKSRQFAHIKVVVEQDYAFIQFSDNGIGIPQEHHKKIFNMFYRATELSKGSGLGLYLLKEAVKKLNGTVDIQSKIDVGTSFFIKIENFLPGKELQQVLHYQKEFK